MCEKWIAVNVANKWKNLGVVDIRSSSKTPQESRREVPAPVLQGLRLSHLSVSVVNTCWAPEEQHTYSGQLFATFMELVYVHVNSLLIFPGIKVHIFINSFIHNNTYIHNVWHLMSPTDSFNDESLWRPQGSAHPRLSQHLQVVGVALNEKHHVFHPSLEMHFGHGLNEPLIPEAPQVLRLEVGEDFPAAAAAAAAAGGVAQTLLVRPEDDGERGGGELDEPLLVRHFCPHSPLLVKRHFSSLKSAVIGEFCHAFLRCAPPSANTTRPERPLGFSALPGKPEEDDEGGGEGGGGGSAGSHR